MLVIFFRLINSPPPLTVDRAPIGFRRRICSLLATPVLIAMLAERLVITGVTVCHLR
jgi:hypothetical protein